METMKICVLIFAAMATAKCSPSGQETAPCPNMTSTQAVGRYLQCQVNLDWSQAETITNLRNCEQFKVEVANVSRVIGPIFDSMNHNKDNTLSSSDLEVFYQSIGVRTDIVETVIQLCDTSNDGELNLEEFTVCSVQYYVELMVRFMTPCSRQFTRSNIDSALAAMTGEYYKTVTADQQKKIIDDLHEGACDNYSLFDLVRAEVEVVRIYNAQANASA